MNKIGLRISIASEGLTSPITINEGDWTRKVVDLRDILKLYDKSDESRFATIMSFSEKGTYIAIARSIPGRVGDYKSAWMFIPNTIEVDGTKIVSLINKVKEQLSLPQRDKELLKELFSETYTETRAADFEASSSDRVYAKRDDSYSLKELLGVNRYQPYYSSYSAILLETVDSFPIIDGNVKDLSLEKIEETIAFYPPENLPKGVSLSIIARDKKLIPFTNPLRLKRGQMPYFQLDRQGFRPIQFPDTAQENGQYCQLPGRLDWEYELPVSKIKVVAANDDKDLTDQASIKVNGVKLSWGQSALIPEAYLKETAVEVAVQGYETKQDYVNLCRYDNIVVRMHRAECEKTWKIELANGHTADMTLRSKYLCGDKYESPLKGYDREDGVLRHTNFGVWKQRIYGFLAAVVICLFIMICAAIYGWYESHTFEWQLGWPPLQVEKIQKAQQTEYQTPDSYGYGSGDVAPANSEVPSIDKAIAYLDNNDKWNRDSLIQYPELEGLFEELNSYDFNKLKSREATLQGSNRYREVLSAIRQNDYKRFSGNFNGENDYVITVSRYIEKLNKPEAVSNPVPEPRVEAKKDKKSGESQSKAKEKTKKQQENKFNAKDLN